MNYKKIFFVAFILASICTVLIAEIQNYGVNTFQSLTTTSGISSLISYYSPEKTDTVAGGAVTVNWNDGNVHYIVLASGANTITMTNPAAGGRYLLYLKQPASGAAGTVTFSPVPLAASATLPTLSTTNSYLDVITLAWEGTASKYVLGAILDLR